LEHLRKGTVEQYESGWVLIRDAISGTTDGTKDFTHDLEEIPRVVDVMRSETSDGKNAIDGNSGVTVAKTSTTITLTIPNGSPLGGDFYFKVRAF
jgi:hypothetical protein